MVGEDLCCWGRTVWWVSIFVAGEGQCGGGEDLCCWGRTVWWVRIFVAGEDSVVGEEGCCRSVEELSPRTTAGNRM